MNEYDDLLGEVAGQKPQSPGPAPSNEYESLLDDELGSVSNKLQQSMYAASQKDPDRQAKVLDTAKEMKLPADTVDRNFDKVSALKKQRTVNYERLAKDSPGIARFLAENPDMAAVAHDDLGNMERIERQVKELSLFGRFGAALAGGITRLGSSMAKAPALAYNLWYLPANIKRKVMGEQQIETPKNLLDNQVTRALDEASSGFESYQPALTTDIIESAKSGDISKAAEAAVSQFLVSAPQMAAGMAAYIYSGGAAGALMMGGLSASQKNAENAQMPGVEPLQGTANAIAYGGMEAAFESVGTFGILSKWENQIAKSVGAGSAAEVAQQFLKTLTYSVLGEANEEFATSLAQDYLDFKSGVNRDAMQGSLGRALNAGVVGAVGGGLMTGPVAAASGASKAYHLRQAKIDQQFYDNLQSAVLESKVQQRSPDINKMAIDSALSQGEVTDVLIPVAAAEAYFQTKNVPVSQVMTEVGALEAYNEAKLTGGDIKIPLSTWATKFAGTEYYQGLKNDVRLRQHSLTANEAKAFEDEERVAMERAAEAQAPKEVDVLEQIKEQTAQRINQVIDGYKERGIQVNIDKNRIDAISEIQARAHLIRALDLGEDPLALFEKEGFKYGMLQGEISQGVESYNQERLILTPKDNGDGTLSIGDQPGENLRVKIDKDLRRAVIESFDATEPGKADILLQSNEKWASGAGSRFAIVPGTLVSSNPTLSQALDRNGYRQDRTDTGDLIYIKDLSESDTNLADGLRPLYNEFNEQERTRSLLNGSLAPDARRGAGRTEARPGISRGPMAGAPSGSPGQNEAIREATRVYQKENRLETARPRSFIKIPEAHQKAFSEAYSKAKHDPNNAAVKKSYAALNTETLKQYQLIKEMGLVIEFAQDTMPYKSTLDAVKDINERGHLFVVPDQYEPGHPFAQNTQETIGGQPLNFGDLFQIVHAVFGHAQEGYGYDLHGQDNAWQLHKLMYSKDAQPALLTEARGRSAAFHLSGRGFEPSRAALLPNSLSGRGLVNLEFFQGRYKNLGFFSKLENIVQAKMGGSASPQQIMGMLKEVKPEEMKWSGLDEFLKGKEKVSKQELIDYLQANQLEIVELKKEQVRTSPLTPEEEQRLADLEEQDMNEGLTPPEREERDRLDAIKNGDVSASDETKFSQYTLPGGENYREVLFTLPERQENQITQLPNGYKVEAYQPALTFGNRKQSTMYKVVDPEGKNFAFGSSDEQSAIDAALRTLNKNRPKDNYTSGHWDEANVLAHVRLNDRVDADGKRVLFVEEIQSDWHQAGRKRGYKGDSVEVDPRAIADVVEGKESENNPNAYRVEEYEGKFVTVDLNGFKDMDSVAETKEESARLYLAKREAASRGSRVPDAPFKKTWHEFALKRIIRMAAEGGYDRVAWTTGEQQAERYDLSKQISTVEYLPESRTLRAFDLNGNNVMDQFVMNESDLSDYIGKDVAEKLLASKPLETGSGKKVHRVEGADLKVGGEGMKGFYDKILVDYAKKLGKKFGAQVGEAGIAAEGGRAANYDVAKEAGAWRVIQRSDDGGTARFVGPNFKTEAEAQGYANELAVGTKVHSLDITPQLKEAALNQGFELFQGDAADARGRILISPLERMIQIAPDADVSTFLHEGAHGWLDMLAQDYQMLKGRDEASLTEGQKRYMKRAEDALKILGVESFEAIETKHHEEFARLAEAYFMEGKAPTQGLAKLFTSFRLWLTQVYRYVQSLGVNMTDDTRSFFDRMIAADEELRIAAEEQNVTPLFGENPESFGLTGERARRYVEAAENAKDEARKRMLKKMMEQIKLQRQALYKEQYKANMERFEADANAMPVYRAIEILTKGKLPGESPLDEVPFKIKLSKEILDQAFDKDIVKKLPRSVYMKEKANGDSGIHPEVAAEMLGGFSNGTDLVYKIAQAIPKKEWVKQQTENYMKERYPDLMDNPEAIEREANSALHNEPRAKLLRMELEILATENLPVLKDVIRKVVRRVPPEAEVRAQAETLIGRKTVKEVRPDVFLRAEWKARKEAGDALVKGDLDKAFEAKRRELLNHELYRAAEDAIERREKALERFKKFRQPDEKLAKSRDMDLVNAGRAILAQVGLASTEKDPASYLEAIRKYDPAAYETVRAIFDSSARGISDYRQMKQGDFDQLVETVKALWDLSKSNKQFQIDGKMINRDDIQMELQGRLLELTKPAEMARIERASTKWDRVKMGLLGLKSAATRVEAWTYAMDGDVVGPFRKYLWNPVSDQANKWRLATLEYRKKYLKESLKPIEKNLTAKPILAKEIRYEFRDRAELLHALLHTGNESNYKKLLLGYGWGQLDENGDLDDSRFKRFIDRAIAEGIITKSDFDYAQSVWNMMDEVKPLAQKAHKQEYGYYFKEITAKPIQTPWGTYRGGYIPAIADTLLNSDAAMREEWDALQNNDNSFMFPSTGRGFTKAREEAYTPKLALDIRLIPQHIDKVLRFAYMQPTISAVGRLVKDRSFRAAMDAVDPTAVNDMLMPWLQRAAQQSVTMPSKGRAGKAADAFFKAVRSRAGMQAMVLNVVNTLQQVTGYSLAAVSVKPRHLRKGILTYIKSPAQVAEDISSKSDFMKVRLAQQAQVVNREIEELSANPSKFEKLRDFSIRHGYVLQSSLQNAMDATVWVGAYNQAAEDGLSEADAVRFADGTVRKTQGSINPEDISRLEGGTAFHRVFTQFYSYFNMQANLLGSEFAVIHRELGLKKGAGRLFYLYLFGFMAPAVVAELVTRAGAGKLDEDDDEEYIDDFLSIFFGSQFRLATAMFPAVGPAINAGVNRFNTKQYDDRIQTSPAISAIESTVSAPKSVYEAIANDGRKKTAIRDTLTAVSMLTGVPVAPLAKPLGYLSDVAEGNANPTGPVDFTRGLVTGRPGPQ